MNKTNIEWCDYSSNPIYATVDGKRGWFCEKVSPGCAHCYSASLNTGRFGNGVDFLPANRGRVEFHLNENELQEWQKPKYAGRRCFPFDMTDLFGEWVPDGWLAWVWMAMARSHMTFQVLTKRPERMRDFVTRWNDLSGETGEFEGVRGPDATRAAHPSGRGQLFAAYLEELGKSTGGEPPPGAAWPTFDWMEGPRWWSTRPLSNVWLGVSCENQRWADERIPILLETPAAVHFISAEPLLGPIDLRRWVTVNGNGRYGRLYDYDALNWVIVGGESGSKHRPFSPDWARQIVGLCAETQTACFVKQLGGFRPGNAIEDLPEDLRVRQWPK